MILGAWTASPNDKDRAGKATLVWGSTIEEARASGGVVDLAALAAEDGLVFDGIAAGDALGRSVATAGDLNGDGNADLLVSA